MIIRHVCKSPIKVTTRTVASSDTDLAGCFDGGWRYALHRILRHSTLVNLKRWLPAVKQ